MNNPTPGTQLARVLDLMQDGQWRTPAEIAQETESRTSSVTSRIRDLRLEGYGSHNIESRKRDIARQLWEYRLVVSTTRIISISPSENAEVIRFLNMDTMQVEQISRDRCRVDSSHGFDRVVAMDSNDNVLSNLVTQQAAL